MIFSVDSPMMRSGGLAPYRQGDPAIGPMSCLHETGLATGFFRSLYRRGTRHGRQGSPRRYSESFARVMPRNDARPNHAPPGGPAGVDTRKLGPIDILGGLGSLRGPFLVQKHQVKS